MQGKQLGKFIPLALVLLFIGLWSTRASLLEVYDTAVATNAKLDSVHGSGR